MTSRAHAPLLRVPPADSTLVATPDIPADDLIPRMLSTSDVLGSGWFGAERIIVLSRHGARQQLAGEFGATDMVTERGDEGVAKIREMTDGLGALPVRARRYARVDDAGHPLHPL